MSIGVFASPIEGFLEKNAVTRVIASHPRDCATRPTSER
jgi:hypothetical protein